MGWVSMRVCLLRCRGSWVGIKAAADMCLDFAGMTLPSCSSALAAMEAQLGWRETMVEDWLIGWDCSYWRFVVLR